YNDWSFPKGKLDPGEHPARAAVRETLEETGIRARLGRRLPTARYFAGCRAKHVRYWAARAISGSFAPNDEVDRLAWLPVDEAGDVLDRPEDVRILDDFSSRPVVTSPLMI